MFLHVVGADMSDISYKPTTDQANTVSPHPKTQDVFF